MPSLGAIPGCHPCPVITGFQHHPCPTARVLSLPLFGGVPAVVSSCAGMYIPDLCWVIHLPLDGFGRFCPVCRAPCLPWLCPWKNTKPPQELLLFSEPGAGVLTPSLWPAVLPVPPSRYLCPWAWPVSPCVTLCPHSLPADPAQGAHRGHLSVCATA